MRICFYLGFVGWYMYWEAYMSECVVRMDIDEMPTACGSCKLSCTVICKEWIKVDRKEIERTKSPNCPILAILPKGHGRLVDMRDIEQMEVSASDKQDEYFVGWNDAIKICQTATTIVPAERSEK